mmetsp:Transcript_13456/g.20224  ORF Transcript_13456/g.20224 Transcript_13456/m.20224 type:complete len:95 (-) Transcript_13456:221-505(-)
MHLSICNTEPELNLDKTQKDVRTFSKLLKEQVAAADARGNPKCYLSSKVRMRPMMIVTKATIVIWMKRITKSLKQQNITNLSGYQKPFQNTTPG